MNFSCFVVSKYKKKVLILSFNEPSKLLLWKHWFSKTSNTGGWRTFYAAFETIFHGKLLREGELIKSEIYIARVTLKVYWIKFVSNWIFCIDICFFKLFNFRPLQTSYIHLIKFNITLYANFSTAIFFFVVSNRASDITKFDKRTLFRFPSNKPNRNQ